MLREHARPIQKLPDALLGSQSCRGDRQPRCEQELRAEREGPQVLVASVERAMERGMVVRGGTREENENEEEENENEEEENEDEDEDEDGSARTSPAPA
ncbi:MAG: hypothetical protein ABGY24_13595 [bacterium]